MKNENYLGLPDHFEGKVKWIDKPIFWVGDEYRTSPLSLEPGGSHVVIERWDGLILGYDKIKFTYEYVRKIIKNLTMKYSKVHPYIDIPIDKNNLSAWTLRDDAIVRDFIKAIYVRTFSIRHNPFQLIWANNSKEGPYVALQQHLDII
jgi:hypothetical protein